MRDDESDDRDDRDDREDYDDDYLPRRFPGIVTGAGVIWIVIGSLSMLNMVVNFALLGANRNAAGPGAAGAGDGACCAGLIGLAFLVCGYQTVTGSARDTLGNGIGSIALGSLQVILAILVAVVGFGGIGNARPPGQGNPGGQGMAPEVSLIVAAMVAAVGATLILAGSLALAGRSAYCQWREDYLEEKRRRRRMHEDEEDDEEDRRRSRRDDDDRED